MTAGFTSLTTPWLGGASAPSVGGDAGLTGLMAPWLGGLSAPDGGTTNAGLTSLLAPWMGGLSAPSGSAPVPGFTSLLGFWLGGLSAPSATPSTGVKNHLNLTLRQMLVDYYEKAFEKKKIEAAPVGKRKTLTLKKIDAKEVEIHERTAKVSEMLAKAEQSLANKNDARVAQLVQSAIKSGQLVTNFDDFERERAARQKRRDDDDLLLYSTIL